MMQVFVVKKDDFNSWRSSIKYTEYHDPKGFEGVKYLKSSNACLAFEGDSYQVSIRPEDSVANIVEGAIGITPRLYSLQEATAELKNRVGKLARLRSWVDSSRRFGVREAHQSIDEELSDMVSTRISHTPNHVLERYEETEYGRDLVACDNEQKICSSAISDGEVLLLKHISLGRIIDECISELSEMYGGGVCARMLIMRNSEEFFRKVAKVGVDGSIEKHEEHFWREQTNRPYAILLYTDEDPHVASYIRTHFDELDKASGDYCDIFVIENPSAVDPYRYWRELLETKTYIVWKLLGWADTVPYLKSEAYKIADQLGIKFDSLPCAVTFDAQATKPKEVIPLGNDLTETFRSLFARYQSRSLLKSIRASIGEKKISLKQETSPNTSPVCFLSHNRQDKSVVREVASTLHSYGIDTWFDEWEILPGDKILKKIEEGISKASAVVIFLSPNSVISKWVEEEMHNALYQSISTNTPRVIPVLLAECDIPLLLAGYHRIDVGSSPSIIATAIRAAVLGITSKPPVQRSS